MWQNLLTALIVAVALFVIGRRAYWQFRRAIDPSKDVSCSCSCNGCSSACDSRKQNNS
ncbi:MAG: hypothetical protein DSY80_01740 [Desulfocapsa sp.]|nr:MAG: hypothetical protein DSY80_01740 [Desulfocapsa sp.]